jgi:hypothetical protein
MTTLSASLRSRPTRIGFLVDHDDPELLRRVFQVCTGLWGGTFNPVIPVCSAIPGAWQDNPFPTPSPTDLARGYVNFFEPDVFVETKEGLAESIGLPQSKLDFHWPRIVPLDAFFETDEERRSGVPFGSSIFQVYKDLYEREFKFVHRHEHRIAVLESLFSSWHINHSWKERGGRHAKFVEPPSVRLDNLWTLAEFTQQLPGPYAHLRASAPGLASDTSI